MQKNNKYLLVLLAISTIFMSLSFTSCKKEKEEAFDFSSYTTLDENDEWGWITVSSDKTKISLDSKPIDDDQGYDPDILEALGLKDYTNDIIDIVQEIHNKLNIPSYVYDKILKTTKADGLQTYEDENVYVWWSYSPSTGIEISYELK